VYKLVLLQILAALCDVSGHIQKIHHGQAGRMLLIRQRNTQNAILVNVSEADLGLIQQAIYKQDSVIYSHFCD